MSGETPAVREALAVYATEAPETEIVPLGYRRTEVGMIPEDWEVKSIHETATVSSGGTPNRSNPTYWGGEIPWVTTAQIDFNTIAACEQFLTEDGLKYSSAKIFPSGTLLVAMYGQGKTRGKVGVLGIEAATNQACAAILLDDTVSHEYVFRYLSSRYENIRKLSNTGNQENLNGTIVKSIQIPVPGEQEQRAIAAALSDVDALIVALDKLIAKKRAVKTAAMQRLLTGKQRLPGFSREWEVKRLGDFAEINSGGTPSSNVPDYYDGSIPWVSITDMTKRGKYIVATDRNLTEKGLANSAARMFPSGTILYAMYASIGECSIADVDLCSSQAILGIRPNRLLNNLYLYFVLVSKKETVKMLGQQGTQANLNAGIVKDFSVPIPSLEEQTAIATVLSDMEAEIAALEARREKTRRIKQGMMQELLTGRTRLV